MKKPEGFKNAYYRRIPCFFNENTSELTGRNKFYSFLLDCMIWIDIHVFNEEGFPIWVEQESED